MAEDDDKTEDPTQKKLDDSRKKGQLGKSQDLSGALMLFSSILLLKLFGGQLADMFFYVTQFLFEEMHTIQFTRENMMSQTLTSLFFVASATAPFFLLMMVAGALVNIVQIGLLWTFEPMTPDINRLNPISGFKNKMSLRSLMMGLMNIAKVSLLSWVAYGVLASAWDRLFTHYNQSVNTTLLLFIELFFKLAFYLILALLILGILDFMYQKWQHLQKMMMSKTEVKDELKNYEGDPRIKQRRRQIQMQMARQRMMRDVKDADVVITNPTHLAIALKYDEFKMKAPIVVAKGADNLALRIRELAKEHKIPTVENKALARALYKSVEVGGPVPEQLFKAVAEVLAFVYNLKKNKQKARI